MSWRKPPSREGTRRRPEILTEQPGQHPALHLYLFRRYILCPNPKMHFFRTQDAAEKRLSTERRRSPSTAARKLSVFTWNRLCRGIPPERSWYRSTTAADSNPETDCLRRSGQSTPTCADTCLRTIGLRSTSGRIPFPRIRNSSDTARSSRRTTERRRLWPAWAAI